MKFSKEFEASFTCECTTCDWEIYEGDTMRFVDGEPTCQECAAEAIEEKITHAGFLYE